MAVVDHALCTVDQVKNWLKPVSPNTSIEVEVIEQLINAITERFERETGRQILARAVTVRINGTGNRMAMLPGYPVVSVDELLALEPDGTTWNEYSTGAADLYVTASGRMILQGANDLAFPCGTANIEVTYQPGWAEIPSDVNVAACQWVADWYRAWALKRDPIENISIAGVTAFVRSEKVPLKVQPVIDLYRNITGAAV